MALLSPRSRWRRLCPRRCRSSRRAEIRSRRGRTNASRRSTRVRLPPTTNGHGNPETAPSHSSVSRLPAERGTAGRMPASRRPPTATKRGCMQLRERTCSFQYRYTTSICADSTPPCHEISLTKNILAKNPVAAQIEPGGRPRTLGAAPDRLICRRDILRHWGTRQTNFEVKPERKGTKTMNGKRAKKPARAAHRRSDRFGLRDDR